MRGRIVTPEARAVTVGLTAAVLFALAMVGLLALMAFVGFSGWLLAAAIVSGVIALGIAAVISA